MKSQFGASQAITGILALHRLENRIKVLVRGVFGYNPDDCIFWQAVGCRKWKRKEDLLNQIR